jgi:hypothetical protein
VITGLTVNEDTFDQIMAAQQEEWGDPIVPAVEKRQLAEWTLDKDGMAIKGCATKTPGGTEYGLIVARRDESGAFDDPRNLTRVQLQTVHDFIGFMLEDSEG